MDTTRRALLLAGGAVPFAPFLAKGEPMSVSLSELEGRLITQARIFHTGRDHENKIQTPETQIEHVLYTQNALSTYPAGRGAELLSLSQSLLSALYYKQGSYMEAVNWSTQAVETAQSIPEDTPKRHALAQAYIRGATAELWYGSPERAEKLAIAGLNQTYGVSAMTDTWLLAQQMRAEAMNRREGSFWSTSKMARDRVQQIRQDGPLTAFTFYPKQLPQAMAIGLSYFDPKMSLNWFDYGLRETPSDAVHVTILDRFHRSVAQIRAGHPEPALDFAVQTIQMVNPVNLTKLHRDRARKVLGELPTNYNSGLSQELRSLVGHS